MMTKSIIGILMALSIGFCCKIFDIPMPAPPSLLGASFILATTTGFLLTEKYLARKK